jgi:hypothetical protein
MLPVAWDLRDLYDSENIHFSLKVGQCQQRKKDLISHFPVIPRGLVLPDAPFSDIHRYSPKDGEEICTF